jgi:hypothetical protein
MATININGGNIAGLQVGDGNTQTNTQHVATGGPTPLEVLAAAAAALPEDVAEDLQEAVIQPLVALASLPVAEQTTPDVAERADALLLRLSPWLPNISKAVAVFGEAALTALASSNPIIAGLVALCKTNAA